MSEYNEIRDVRKRIERLEARLRSQETAPRLGAAGIGPEGLTIRDGGSIAVIGGGNVNIENGNISMFDGTVYVNNIQLKAVSVSSYSNYDVDNTYSYDSTWTTTKTYSLAVPPWAVNGIIVASGSVSLQPVTGQNPVLPQYSYGNARFLIDGTAQAVAPSFTRTYGGAFISQTAVLSGQKVMPVTGLSSVSIAFQAIRTFGTSSTATAHDVSILGIWSK